MSRSGYVDDYDYIELYRRTVENAIAGKRGQAFLREMAAALDAMPEKVLIADELVDREGSVCAIGSVCAARKLDVSNIDYEDPKSVAKAVGIAPCLAAEIEYENDEHGRHRYRPATLDWHSETPAERWQRMRNWVQGNILP